MVAHVIRARPREGAARRMALLTTQAAVRLRAERLGAVRVRRRRQGDDESRHLLLPAAAHPPPRDPPLEGSRDASRSSRPRTSRRRALNLKPESHRPVVHEADLHVGAEAAGRHAACRRAASTKIRRAACPPPAGAAAREARPRALAVSATSVNCGTASSSPPMSVSERFILPCASGKMR